MIENPPACVPTNLPAVSPCTRPRVLSAPRPLDLTATPNSGAVAHSSAGKRGGKFEKLQIDGHATTDSQPQTQTDGRSTSRRGFSARRLVFCTSLKSSSLSPAQSWVADADITLLYGTTREEANFFRAAAPSVSETQNACEVFEAESAFDGLARFLLLPAT